MSGINFKSYQEKTLIPSSSQNQHYSQYEVHNTWDSAEHATHEPDTADNVPDQAYDLANQAQPGSKRESVLHPLIDKRTFLLEAFKHQANEMAAAPSTSDNREQIAREVLLGRNFHSAPGSKVELTGVSGLGGSGWGSSRWGGSSRAGSSRGSAGRGQLSASERERLNRNRGEAVRERDHAIEQRTAIREDVQYYENTGQIDDPGYADAQRSLQALNRFIRSKQGLIDEIDRRLGN